MQNRFVVLLVGLLCVSTLGAAGGVTAATQPADGALAIELVDHGSPVAAAVDGNSTAGTCNYPVTLTDATGSEITLDERPIG